MSTYIVGHTKPDTDAVVSAMALAYLYEHKDCFGYKQATPVITDPLNPETEYLFEKLGLDSPKLLRSGEVKATDHFILVDHNEASQRLEAVTDDQIVEIIDHHKVNLNLNQPIFMTFKAWGSTSTIIYYLMESNDVMPDKVLAELMLAAILSDTVGYKSATTTDKDKEIGDKLAKIAQIEDVEAYTLELFKAKSNVGKLSAEEIVRNDYKIYDFSEKTYIGQIETVEQSAVLERKTNLIEAMNQIRKAENLDLVFCAVTDVLAVNTKILIAGEKEKQILEKAFGTKAQDELIDIGSRMSRKKEITPAIEKAIQA